MCHILEYRFYSCEIIKSNNYYLKILFPKNMVPVAWNKRRCSHLLNHTLCITWSILSCLVLTVTQSACIFIPSYSMLVLKGRLNHLPSNNYLTAKPMLFTLYLIRSGRECTVWFEFLKVSLIWGCIWEVELVFNVVFIYSIFQVEWITVYKVRFIWALDLSCL